VAIPADVKVEGDHLVGVTVLDDGSIAACSKFGVVLVARMKQDSSFVLMNTLLLEDHATAKPAHVSNSISSDGQMMFIATQREMMRVDYDSASSKLLFKWSNVYGLPQPWYVGRLGPGSGSTPTITTCGGQSLVTITDGALPMNLIYYDVKTGKNVATKKVQFADRENGALPTTSEQSVAVDGCKAFVVQNYMGTELLAPEIKCTGLPSRPERLRTTLPDFCNHMTFNSSDMFTAKACPAVFGCASMGAAVYELNPKTQKADGNVVMHVLLPFIVEW